ncbi:purine-binding chemotaxis protein CheW [Campylobacter sp. RM9344]|uniref:Purine-binding chemotaxis protein CheW n=1 Tax=Campylobacter californiensis TaxID=1032243 RepID=A0AAW3ZSR7_9BACT|nr:MULTISPECIES: chemotaxis protein CheW [unclassified Campylobacter]MBE2984145.1 purine-binding chemotaxis protein CheW [Campylobacter sp. RM6883]MBE2986231.1 purine-binding chemotaxis protein CheW [Campylobacter sp. RM12919]MBE2988228.1 purine-binding chemotaxis protein CheW [Campylobacter sp. RM12920]MBE2995515.1 purine-binding chemotaxis protein CheW [Campylobacter sp. RM6913]MBE3022614.1 purine-binding chemotaxis protein CheW [Campylobacter sp. 7477a]MBE3030326.1 purine-binding chemotaxi
MSNKLNEVLQRQKQQIDEPSKSSEDIIQLVGFVVGEEEYAIPILNIQEIIKPIEFTRVPSVPEYVLGVFNLRGNVIPLIDLRKRFSLNASKQSASTRYIVMKDEENIAGFVIDRLTEAIRINRNRIDPPPETLIKDKGMIYGIGKRDQNILTILKVESLLKRDF